MEDSIQWHVFCLFPGQKEFQRQYIWLDINNVAHQWNATLFSIAYCLSLWVINQLGILWWINGMSGPKQLCYRFSLFVATRNTKSLFSSAAIKNKYNLTSIINISDVFYFTPIKTLLLSQDYWYLKTFAIVEHNMQSGGHVASTKQFKVFSCLF